ncbi:pre-mRNA processing factor 3-domain-containing protein [Pseudomassariella vexata]|uniref:Pre-mRNA processing factor 3-domain-containing protein n=1 Tax=Pseudomassariella vexata TaxID=1141098 RepID=A0A1Y2E068_9PEZI|nr:pre-mRNA processing factor 3-domain-containing protein [Pseudomassariella vexata]ORY64265.1 pre-mRNA processing factor 3-domain-containing protein [Pseudomassariella vexata]
MDRHGSPGLGPRHDGSSRVQKPESAADKLAALKARVAAAIGMTQTKGPGGGSSNGLGSLGGLNSVTNQARGGLNVGLHPALADVGQIKPPSKTFNDSRSSRSAPKPSQKQKPLDLAGPSADEIKNNPYYDPSLSAPTTKPRQSRQLIFNQKGKYIAQANALRRQAALEALKKKIAAQTRKVGIDEDIDVEKNFLVEAPPAIEWWDEGLVDGNTYDSIEDPNFIKIDTPDTIVTSYIQHPVAIEPPQDKNAPAPKPMYLTSKEMAKLRRQRRGAELKEQQAKIRLGLEPPPPPKVKKGNLMRVLGSEAVLDPTAVEARVEKEIRGRFEIHMQTNEERKLSKEERHTKLIKHQEEDAAKGLHILVFKISTLANGQHRYKININAEQMALTGIALMNPKMNLVIVEGGAYSTRKYKKLMCDRIDWTENAPSRDKDGKSEALRQWLMAEDEKGELKDMSLNKCQLIFEGEVKSRGFRKWGSKVCETDAEARETLARAKMENFWNLAKSTQ